MKKVIVLGGGMVGSVMAADLSDRYDVTVADLDQSAKERQHPGVHFIETDLSNEDSIAKVIEEFDLVIGAVPGSMGHDVFSRVINAGKDIVDISFFPEDGTYLKELASEKGVFATYDCGVAPGFSNMVLGFEHTRRPLSSFKCMVGGLPVERIKPYEYKAPFSPVDVIEEYTRPARLVRDGETIELPALSELEHFTEEGIGELESFVSDGLRSLLLVKGISEMEEKTIRYPGHAAAMQTLRDYGFFDEQIGVSGVSPRQQTQELLFEQWRLKPNDDEFTLMLMELENEQEEIKYKLFDQRDKTSGFSSMSRTTGFTATAVASLLLQGAISTKGLQMPEQLAADPSIFEAVQKYLRERGIEIRREENSKK